MKWTKKTPWLMEAETGHKVSKFVVGIETRYRASYEGKWIAPVMLNSTEAFKAAENHARFLGLL